jgi:hypothetical protein
MDKLAVGEESTKINGLLFIFMLKKEACGLMII